MCIDLHLLRNTLWTLKHLLTRNVSIMVLSVDKVLNKGTSFLVCGISCMYKYVSNGDTSSRWRHNDHDGVSNHQPDGCLLNRLFRRRSKKTSKFRVTGLCVGNSPGPVNSPHKGPVMRKMFPFDDVIMSSLAGSHWHISRRKYFSLVGVFFSILSHTLIKITYCVL